MLVREPHSSAILHIAVPRRVVSQKGAAWSMIVVVAAAAMLAASPIDAGAQCAGTQFQNYTGGGATACPCSFRTSKRVRYSRCPRASARSEILKVGVGWGPHSAAPARASQRRIHIYEGGLPNPGAPIFSLIGPHS
jgi:hypothetical protein